MKLLAWVALVPLALLAHHAIDADFDRGVQTEVRGTLVGIEWVNPHVLLFVDASQADGSLVHWKFEFNQPNGLRRNGWTEDMLRQGDIVRVTAHPAKNGSPVGSVRKLVLPSGKSIEVEDRFKMSLRPRGAVPPATASTVAASSGSR